MILSAISVAWKSFPLSSVFIDFLVQCLEVFSRFLPEYSCWSYDLNALLHIFVSSLLVYIKGIYSSGLVLCPETLLNVSIRVKSFLVDSVTSFKDRIMSSASRGALTSFLFLSHLSFLSLVLLL